MAYEWDAAKNRANLAKHGVDFADAVGVFEDDLALPVLTPMHEASVAFRLSALTPSVAI